MNTQISKHNVWHIVNEGERQELLRLFWRRKELSDRGELTLGANNYLEVVLSRDPIISESDINDFPMMPFPAEVDCNFVRFIKWTGGAQVFAELIGMMYQSRYRFTHEAADLVMSYIKAGADAPFKRSTVGIRRPKVVNKEYIDTIVEAGLKSEITELYWHQCELYTDGAINEEAIAEMHRIVRAAPVGSIVNDVDLEEMGFSQFPEFIDEDFVRFVLFTGATGMIQPIMLERHRDHRLVSDGAYKLCQEWLREQERKNAIADEPAEPDEAPAGELEPATDAEIDHIAELMADSVMRVRIKKELAELMRSHEKDSRSEIWPDALLMRDDVRDAKVYVRIDCAKERMLRLFEAEGYEMGSIPCKILDAAFSVIAGEVLIGFAPKIAGIHPMAVTLSRALLR